MQSDNASGGGRYVDKYDYHSGGAVHCKVSVVLSLCTCMLHSHSLGQNHEKKRLGYLSFATALRLSPRNEACLHQRNTSKLQWGKFNLCLRIKLRHKVFCCVSVVPQSSSPTLETENTLCTEWWHFPCVFLSLCWWPIFSPFSYLILQTSTMAEYWEIFVSMTKNISLCQRLPHMPASNARTSALWGREKKKKNRWCSVSYFD